MTFDARVHGIVDSGDAVALALRDKRQFITAIVESALVDRETLDLARSITLESIVRVTGSLKSNPGRKGSTPDITVTNLVARAEAIHDAPKPIVPHGAPGEMQAQQNATSTIYLNERLNNRVADVRVAATGTIFKLLSGILQLAVEHQTRDNFNWVNTPGLINYKIPGDDDYFPVSYLNQGQVHLAQTGEFHLQIALAMDLRRVFDIRNVFRREPKVSSRHLTEVS